jgi:hypothetical protein
MILKLYLFNNIYICGETYSLFNLAWIEGALETSDKIITKNS